jgi:hypothetical protein
MPTTSGGRARSRALRRAPLLVVALLCAVLTLAIPLGSAGAAKKDAAKSGGESAGYYSEHPCALITQKQVESEFGTPFAAGQSSPSSSLGSCQYTTTTPSSSYPNGRTVQINFYNSSDSFFKSGKVHNLPSLGHGAFCDADGNLLANVGDIGGLPEHLEIVNSGTCAQLTSLGRDAFARMK